MRRDMLLLTLVFVILLFTGCSIGGSSAFPQGGIEGDIGRRQESNRSEVLLRTDAKSSITNGAGILSFTVTNLSQDVAPGVMVQCVFRNPNGAEVWRENYMKADGLQPGERWEYEAVFYPGITNGALSCEAAVAW